MDNTLFENTMFVSLTWAEGVCGVKVDRKFMGYLEYKEKKEQR